MQSKQSSTYITLLTGLTRDSFSTVTSHHDTPRLEKFQALTCSSQGPKVEQYFCNPWCLGVSCKVQWREATHGPHVHQAAHMRKSLSHCELKYSKLLIYELDNTVIGPCHTCSCHTMPCRTMSCHARPGVWVAWHLGS